MGDHPLKCEIIRDLLPSYIDGLTSDVTNEAIESHVGICSDCADTLKRMREPERREQPAAKEIDYLKKVRRRSRRMLTLGILAAILLVTALFFVRFYVVGNVASTNLINYDVAVSNGTIIFSGNFLDSGSGYSHTSIKEEGGVVTISVYTAPKSFINSSSFSTQYKTGGDISEICLGDLIIWENGNMISRTTAQVFAAKNPYVGDMPANSEVASALGITDQFGGYKNELQTNSEPYGWTLALEDQIPADGEDAAKNTMKADSFVMLAVVGNLGYVTWDYRTEYGEQTYTMTAEEATAYAGRDIKLCADTATGLQTLMQSLRIK